MATYEGRMRTNYFCVKSEEAFEQWLASYLPNAEKISKDNKVGFISYGAFVFCDPNGEDVDEDKAIQTLQNLLDEREICVVYEVGFEKFQYFESFATIITKNSINYLSFTKCLLDKVLELTEQEDLTIDIYY